MTITTMTLRLHLQRAWRNDNNEQLTWRMKITTMTMTVEGPRLHRLFVQPPGPVVFLALLVVLLLSVDVDCLFVCLSVCLFVCLLVLFIVVPLFQAASLHGFSTRDMFFCWQFEDIFGCCFFGKPLAYQQVTHIFIDEIHEPTSQLECALWFCRVCFGFDSRSSFCRVCFCQPTTLLCCC